MFFQSSYFPDFNKLLRYIFYPKVPARKTYELSENTDFEYPSKCVNEQCDRVIYILHIFIGAVVLGIVKSK